MIMARKSREHPATAANIRRIAASLRSEQADIRTSFGGGATEQPTVAARSAAGVQRRNRITVAPNMTGQIP
jgi:hypothetical protein